MKSEPEDYHDSPVAWFVMLFDARRKHDVDQAARSLRELHRLGVSVEFLPPKDKADTRTRKGARHATR